VIWHLVRFDLGHLDEDLRREVEADLAGLEDLDEVAWLRVARDVEQPEVTGLMTAFVDAEALATYRVHPRHVPVVERIRDLEVPTVRMDLPTDDDPTTLP
jgi:pyridoxine 5'-phosphate synthase PdxJ